MTKTTYIDMINKVNESKWLRRYVLFADSALTKFVYLTYPIMLVCMFLRGDTNFIPSLLIPAVSFVMLSIFRYIYNAPRPYEVFRTKPIIKKDSQGKSFPSRHVFSVFIIAFTMLQVNIFMGIILILIGILIAVNRVIGGVHFPKDVIAGFLFALFSGMLGYYVVIPYISFL